jgi:PAS domain S-box-containing protein
MDANLINANIAIIGGGRFCKLFLQYLFDNELTDQHPRILGIADIDSRAVGLLYAQKKGIFTTTDFKELYDLDGLEVLFELTGNRTLRDSIEQTKPSGVEFIDHAEARGIWSSLQIENERRTFLKSLKKKNYTVAEIRKLFDQYSGSLAEAVNRRNQRYLEIERELIESERTLSQIIQGSTLPTFVIDNRHIVTHWNNAMEELTGVPAEEIVGTNKHWTPFWDEERPAMADVVLDQIGEEEIRKLYGRTWRKSSLIEGAYEAEIFFANLGDHGRWCWFTAAPIRSPGGEIIGAIETLWDKTEDRIAAEERERHTRLLTDTARDLAKSEKALTQIVQGSTIPTFVIDQNHKVAHWNKALERLSGISAFEIIGTNKQWTPFYGNQRPTMADVIVDQTGEEEIKKLYGAQWRKSALIDGAYEAEGFFPKLGEDGRWCWFTAAPIKSPVGEIVGAVETLWDKTEDKRREEERELHTSELSTLCSIYSALSASIDIDTGIIGAMQEVRNFLSADGICIYMSGGDGNYYYRYGDGLSQEICEKIKIADQNSIVQQVAQKGEFTIYDHQPEGDSDEIAFIIEEGINSLAYIPISLKEKKSVGVIRIVSRMHEQFSADQRNVLELIGNRIGVALENSELQRQYIKSEKKYRTLFNSDPHPIFILNSESFKILDINQRAQDSYGYDRKELLGVSFLELGEDSDPEMIRGLKDLSRVHSSLFVKKKHFRKGRRPFYVNINISHATYGESSVIIASTTDISESIEKETQLIQASKMTTMGQMAAGIAHEINQPLNVIQICSDFFLKMIDRSESISAADFKSMAEDISSNVQRATRIIQHMRDFSRQSDAQRSRININDPIRDVFKVLGHQLRVHEVKLQLDLDPDLPFILAEHNRLEQVFINLVTNALDAMDEKIAQPEYAGSEKCLKIRSSAENGTVTVIVSDTGIGMSKELQQKIFEPFFTTKQVGKGTGLGVSISYGIVKDYDGTIDIDSAVGMGTTFTLRFPAVSEQTT